MEDCMEELEYGTLEAEAIAAFAAERVMVLATSRDGRTSARAVSTVNRGLEVWFQASADSLKVAQIGGNPRAALCRGNMQVEGRAEIAGTAGDGACAWFREEYRRVHPGSFALYGELPGERAVRFVPSLVSFWKYEGGRPFRDYLDLEARRAWREAQPFTPPRR
jgi:hypothetical protein